MNSMKKSLSKPLTFLVTTIIVAQLNISALAAESSTPPIQNNIVITNNSVIGDTVKVTTLKAGDVVNVYRDDTSSSALGSATVSEMSTEAIVSIPQLGISSGRIYVTVTSAPLIESTRIVQDYSAEPTSPKVENMTIVNNASIPDTLKVTGLAVGDVIKVYKDASITTPLAITKVATGKFEAIVSLTQLSKEPGSVFITLTGVGLKESARVEKTYVAEEVSVSLSLVGTAEIPAKNTITVVNNASMSDTVDITGLSVGDVLKVYDLKIDGKMLGTATVATSKTVVTISIPQISSDLGNVYVSVTNKGKLESERVKSGYDAEGETIAPEATSIIVLNKTGASDTVKVTGVKTGDVIKVYKDDTIITPLGKVIVTGTATEAIILIAQLGISKDSLFVTKANIGLKESTRTEKSYDAELVSTGSTADNITIVNNALMTDTVKVTGLSVGDIVKVYNLETLGKLLGTATVATSKTEATVNIPQISSDLGSVYVSVTNKGKLESERLEKEYAAEGETTALESTSIAVLNNTGAADTVKVTGVKAGDVIKVYKDDTITTPLGKVIVTGIASEAIASIVQLGITEGSVFVTVTSAGLSESTRTKHTYAAELISTAPIEDTITIVNNALMTDTVKVTGLSVGDVVKVYNLETAGKVLGTATVATSKSEATVSISQISSDLGNVYISVTNKGKLESERVEREYAAEGETVALESTSIAVLNKTGSPDTVKVTGLKAGDVIKVYKDDTITTPLGKVTVTGTAKEATISIAQLGISEGSVFVTVANTALKESTRTKQNYAAELISTEPIADNITIVNNASLADTVTVAGLSEGDIVKVYNVETLGKSLGTATVAKGKVEVTVSISQTTTEAGNVYVSVTNKAKLESERVEKEYIEEATTPDPDENKIVAINNVGMDLVLIYGLKSGDVVKVYDSATDGKVLGTLKVAVNQSYATIAITQLGAIGGDIYISLTRTGLKESERVKKSVDAE
jgi:hypothetical protein